MQKLLSIIYVYYNTPREIIDSINSVNKTTKKTKFEILIIDNNSPKILPPVRNNKINLKIIKNLHNVGFGKAVNQAAKLCRGEYILILNPDTKVLDNSIDLMIERIEKERKIGIIGSQLINRKGKILHSIGSNPKLPDILFALSFINKLWPQNPYSKKYWALNVDRNKEQETEIVGGAAILMRKKLFEKVGGFDERFFLYFEEIDLCNRIRKLGFKIIYFPKAKIIHLVGKSSNDKKFINKHYERSRFLYLKKYYGTLPAFFSEAFLRLPGYIKSTYQ